MSEEKKEKKFDPKTALNSFSALGREVTHRFRAPTGQVSFWVALIFGVILLGGLGIWVEIYKYATISDANAENVKTAIHTFFPALAFTATLQLILETDRKYLRSSGLALGGDLRLKTDPL